MNRSLVRRLGLAVLCGVLGLVLNMWRTGSVAPLLLGRIVTLPVAILYGPWFGVIAAAIAGDRRRRACSAARSPFCRSKRWWSARSPDVDARRCSAACIVWTLVALALVAVPRLIGVGYTREMVLPIALQVIVSGLVAVVVADLVATGASARRLVEQDQRPERRIRSYAFHAFVLVAMLPVLLLAAVDGQLSAAQAGVGRRRATARGGRRR